MKSNKIDVIIPVYNVENYLEQCLESVCNQSQPFYEIILVNDGSTDNSLDICKKYAKEYSNIKIVSQLNKGLASARNKGMQYAKSDWIIFVDSDDYISLDLVKIINNEINNSKFDICYYNASILNEINELNIKKDKYIRGNCMYEKNMNGMEFFLNSYNDKFIVSACCAVYSLDFLKNYYIYFPDGYVYEDNFFSLQTIINAKKIKCISDQLYIRRYREDSITTSIVTRKKCNDLLGIDLMIVNYIFKRKFGEVDIKFLKQYITNNYLYASRFVRKYKYDESIQEKLSKLANTIRKEWCSKWINKTISWDDCVNLLSISDSDIYTKEIREQLIFLLKEKLKRMHLSDKTKRIGIYGIGKHTDSLLKLYEIFVGKIECNFFYILTKTKENKYQEKEVYSVNDLPVEWDQIIVSSLIYQHEMREAIAEAGVDINKVEYIYYENETRDLIWVETVLNV